MLIDTHCHLDFPEFDKDRDETIQRANDAGIGCMINIGSSLEGSKKSLELAKQYDCIYTSAGIHPHEADRFDKQQEQALKGLLGQSKVVAVGEIGLDYFKNYSQPQNQKILFQSLVNLAGEFNLPLVIHTRQAEDDTLKVLKESGVEKAVVHCFSGDVAFLNKCLDLGFFISFTCNITYKKADNLRRLVSLVPLERLLLETDAPFLPPQDLRGKRNEPASVLVLAQEIARIKQISPEEVAGKTTGNARAFFNLP
ncbi:MAG: hypothetical protein A3K83_07325 [Omnitrophica WOR_2 bacterium RBG_13_44_8b]|nr:MAG: hypothetical protein A3K83_07325 [Omnitrophica WOR_2 bacterium RBG_13_44_8b]